MGIASSCMTAPPCSGCLPEGLYGRRTPLPPSIRLSPWGVRIAGRFLASAVLRSGRALRGYWRGLQGASLCAIVVTLVMIVEIVVIDPGHDPGGQGVGRQGRRGARKLAWDYTTSTLLSASIHPTSENRNSANFAFIEFYEVRVL